MKPQLGPFSIDGGSAMPNSRLLRREIQVVQAGRVVAEEPRQVPAELAVPYRSGKRAGLAGRADPNLGGAKG